jgi:hypothetical protein
MKKYKWIFLLVIVSKTIFGQVDGVKKTVLHTLGKNEILNYHEYSVYQSSGKNNYSFVVSDTSTQKETFVFNGKIIHSDYIGNNIQEIDLSKENGYIFKFYENEQSFVNVRGKVEGPFEEVQCSVYDVDGSYKIPENYDFFYKLGGIWYSYFEGNAQMLAKDEEKKDEVEWVSLKTSTGENGKWYLSGISGNAYKDNVRYDELVSVVKNTVYIVYVCVNNGQKYVVMNGVLSEAFDRGDYINIDLIGKNYMYNYSKNGKKYVNINGKSIAIDCDDYHYGNILSNGVYYYSYSKNDNTYANINGKIFGPYQDINEIQMYSTGKYAFVFAKDGLYYVNNNGVISKGYPSAFGLNYESDGSLNYFYSMEDGWLYQSVNGQVKKQEPKIGDVVGEFVPSFEKYIIYSKNKTHTLTVDIAYDYVVIDGKSYGKSPAIRAWYDETKNSFVWSALEGKELVVYEYKLL